LANQDIKDEIKKSGLKHWEVAAEYGITDGNFSRLLRLELKPDKKERIHEIIKKLKVEKSKDISA